VLAVAPLQLYSDTRTRLVVHRSKHHAKGARAEDFDEDKAAAIWPDGEGQRCSVEAGVLCAI
jgi:hypothetical protein